MNDWISEFLKELTSEWVTELVVSDSVTGIYWHERSAFQSVSVRAVNWQWRKWPLKTSTFLFFLNHILTRGQICTKYWYIWQCMVIKLQICKSNVQYYDYWGLPDMGGLTLPHEWAAIKLRQGSITPNVGLSDRQKKNLVSFWRGFIDNTNIYYYWGVS